MDFQVLINNLKKNLDDFDHIYQNSDLFRQILTHIEAHRDDPSLVKLSDDIFRRLDGAIPDKIHASIYKSILTLNPNHGQIPLKLADYYQRKNNHEKAQHYYDQSVRNGDKYGMYYFGLYWGKQKNSALAYNYYKMGTEHGCYPAAIELANFHADHDGVLPILIQFTKNELKKCKNYEEIENFINWMKAFKLRDRIMTEIFINI